MFTLPRIHRDIKPENILLHDGRAMVADFGIALAVSAAAGGRMTETGLSLGTPHYMSPEQATAEKDLTNRSDIYPLGSVLYELLAGAPPHLGGTAQQIIMRIVTDEARPVTDLRKSVPPHVAAAVAKALEKVAADRFSSAAEFAEALRHPEMMERFPTQAETDVKGRVPRRVDTRFVGMTLAFVAAAVSALVGWLRSSPEPLVARFSIAVPDGAPLLTTTSSRTLALSPDGRHLVYVGPDRQLFVRDLDDFEVRPLARTHGAHTPVFSPDGSWVVFHTQGRALQRSAVAGGPPVRITGSSSTRGLAWGEGATIVFSPGLNEGLYRVSPGGEARSQLTVPDSAAGEIGHRWPHVLPGGKAVLFTVWTGSAETATIAVLDIETGEIKPLVGGTNPHYVTLGYLLYVTADGSLLAVPFDAERHEITGNPVALVDSITVKPSGAAEYAVSGNGTLAYLTGGSVEMELVLVGRDGAERPLMSGVIEPASPRFSPDGTRVAYVATSGQGNRDIWVHDIQQGVQTRLTFAGVNDHPAWFANGDSIAFTPAVGGHRHCTLVRQTTAALPSSCWPSMMHGKSAGHRIVSGQPFAWSRAKRKISSYGIAERATRHRT